MQAASNAIIGMLASNRNAAIALSATEVTARKKSDPSSTSIEAEPRSKPLNLFGAERAGTPQWQSLPEQRFSLKNGMTWF
jgi:hypothetical protein